MTLIDAIKKQVSFACSLKYEQLSAETVAKATEIVLDSVGCMVAGGTGKNYAHLPHGCAPVIGYGLYDTYAAAFANGTAMVADEMDEGNQFAVGHPACHILPALLAVGCERHLSGKAFIAAFVAAYEITCRLMGAAALKDGVHVHGTSGVIGAAIAAGLARQVDEGMLFEATVLALSAPQASNWQSAFSGYTVRNAYVGLSNEVGIRCVDMAQMGIRSGEEALDWIWNNLFGNGIKTEKLTDGLGEDFLILKNYMKIHSACRYVHAFADVIESWLGEGKINGAIRRIDINTYKAASKLSGQSARNTFAAKFSLPISLAVLLKTGTLEYGTITEAVIADQAVTELAKKITVTENPAYTALLPQTRKSDITITFDDGRTLSAALSGARGDFDNPLSKAELLNKYTRMTAHLGHDASVSIKEWILNLKTSEDMVKGICSF